MFFLEDHSNITVFLYICVYLALVLKENSYHDIIWHIYKLYKVNLICHGFYLLLFCICSFVYCFVHFAVRNFDVRTFKKDFTFFLSLRKRPLFVANSNPNCPSFVRKRRMHWSQKEISFAPEGRICLSKDEFFRLKFDTYSSQTSRLFLRHHKE